MKAWRAKLLRILSDSSMLADSRNDFVSRKHSSKVNNAESRFDFEARNRFYDRKSSTGASWRSALKQIFYCFRFLSAQQKPFCASFPSINRRSERFRLLVKDTQASYGLTNIVLPRFSPHETLLIKVMLNVLSWMTRRMLLISFVSPSFPRPVTWVSRWKERSGGGGKNP